MKRKIWQAFVVAGLMLFLSRTAVQRDLQASAFQEKIEQCLKAGELPVVVLSQESGEYESIGKSALWAAEYAAAQVNKNGGVNGCNVRIVSENTGSDNSKALSLYQGASRTASAVLGPVDAPETVYIAQNAEKKWDGPSGCLFICGIPTAYGTVWNFLYE